MNLYCMFLFVQICKFCLSLRASYCSSLFTVLFFFLWIYFFAKAEPTTQRNKLSKASRNWEYWADHEWTSGLLIDLVPVLIYVCFLELVAKTRNPQWLHKGVLTAACFCCLESLCQNWVQSSEETSAVRGCVGVAPFQPATVQQHQKVIGRTTPVWLGFLADELPRDLCLVWALFYMEGRIPLFPSLCLHACTYSWNFLAPSSALFSSCCALEGNISYVAVPACLACQINFRTSLK